MQLQGLYGALSACTVPRTVQRQAAQPRLCTAPLFTCHPPCGARRDLRPGAARVLGRSNSCHGTDVPEPAVLISEVGPRDGLQSVARTLPTAAKLAWIEALHAAGLREIEVASFVPAALLPQMADAAEVARHALTLSGLKVMALAYLRRLARRPGRLTVRAGRVGQRRHRRPRVHVRGDGHRDQRRLAQAGRRARPTASRPAGRADLRDDAGSRAALGIGPVAARRAATWLHPHPALSRRRG